AMMRPIKLLESSAGVGDADPRPEGAGSFGGLLLGRKSRSIVLNLHAQHAVFRAGANVQPADAGKRSDAVANGVLDERLEHEVGHRRVHHLRVDVNPDLKSVAQARFLDL